MFSATRAGTFVPPKKKSMGQLRGIRSPPGLDKQEPDSPQEQEALLGLSSEAEASSGHDEESGALTGSLSNSLHFRDRRGRRLGMASVAITRGAACPRRVSMDMTRRDELKLFLWARQDLKHVSGDMARHSWPWCGLESAAGRRVCHMHSTCTPGGLATWTAGWFGWAADGGRSPRERRAWRSRGRRRAWGTRGNPAKLPRRLAVGYGGITRGDFLAAGQTDRNKTKLSKNEKTKRWKRGAAYSRFRSGLLSRCTQQGESRNTQMRIKLKSKSLFQTRQDKAKKIAQIIIMKDLVEVAGRDLQPQIRKSWDSMENANKKRK